MPLPLGFYNGKGRKAMRLFITSFVVSFIAFRMWRHAKERRGEL